MTILADAYGRTDSAYHTLVQKINSPYPIVMVSWVENFVFNESLLSIKEAVLVCFCEYGWDFEINNTHIWGINKDTSGRYIGEEWDKFDNWVKSCGIKVIFKRELLSKDVSAKVHPIEYPCTVDQYQIQTKDQFNSRPINAFQYWGRSNECRIRIHGEIWLHSFKKGFQVCDNIYYANAYLNEEKGEKWVSLWIPHYARVEIKNLLDINNISKLSLSWEGAGTKCFRTTGESGVNSILVMHKNALAWTYDWDETNCVLVENGKEIEGIEKALANPNLHDVYIKCVENTNKYRTENYIKHIGGIIHKA